MYQKYGSPDNLRLTDLDKPVPRDQEVLVKVHAASVNYGNLVLLKGKPYLARFAYGLLKPKHTIPGGDIAGQWKQWAKESHSLSQAIIKVLFQSPLLLLLLWIYPAG